MIDKLRIFGASRDRFEYSDKLSAALREAVQPAVKFRRFCDWHDWRDRHPLLRRILPRRLQRFIVRHLPRDPRYEWKISYGPPAADAPRRGRRRLT